MKTNVDAKITIKGVSREFPLTIDWDGLDLEDMRAMAQRSLVIAFQNGKRTANKGEGEWPTPAQCNIKAVDHKIGSRAKVERDPVKLIEAGALSAEQLAQLAKLIASKQAALKGAEASTK